MKNTWELLGTSLPYEVQNAYTGTDKKHIYLFGGKLKETNAPTNKCVRMNVETLEWEEIATLPFAMTNDTSTPAPYVDGKFYIVGGELTSEEGTTAETNRVFAFDVATGVWSEVAPRPIVASRSGICDAYGKIYSFGGRCKSGSNYVFYANVYCYEPKTDTWTRKADARGYYTGASSSKNYNYMCCSVFACHNGKGQIYVGAGSGLHGTSTSSSSSSSNPGQTGNINVYVINSDSWYTTYYDKSWSCGYTAEHISAVELEEKVFVLGGYYSNGSNEFRYTNYLRYLDHYDGGSATGTAKETLPERMYTSNVVAIDEYIYMLGGYSVSDYTSQCYRYTTDLSNFRVILNWENPIPENSTVIPTVTNLTYKTKE